MATNNVVIQRRRWVPVTPRSVTRSGTTITCQFWVPTAPLVIDTSAGTGFPDIRLNNRFYGLEYWTYNGTSWSNKPITSVSVSGDTATIVLTSNPGSPALESLGYAITGTNVGGFNGNSNLNAGREGGNIHDSDTTSGVMTGKPSYNWATPFFVPIGFKWNPFQDNGISGNVGMAGRLTVQ